MRPHKILSICLALLTSVALLAACGSGGGSSSDSPAGSGPAATGVLVDPYIVGAILQEIGPDGSILQRQSTPTKADGSFSFPQPLTSGALITIKPSPIPKHNGVDYHGILKRRIGTNPDGVWIVSPLTTLLAGDLSEQQLLDLFAAAGITDLTSADLYADPLKAIDMTGSLTGNSRLAPLQAALAANTFMEIKGNYSPSSATLNDPLFQDAVAATREILNLAIFNTLADDPAVVDAGAPLTAEDFIATATSLCQVVSNQLRQGASLSGAIDAALATAPATARQHYQGNHGPQDPGTTAGDSVAGKVVYDNNCGSCHKFGSADTSGFAPDLAGKGMMIAGKIAGGHNGVSLSNANLADLAAYLDAGSSPAPTPGPTPAPLDGAALYNANCDGCHTFGSVDTSGFAPDLNNKSELIAAKLAAGHNGVALASAEVATLVDWVLANSVAATDPSPGPTPAPLDGAALYDASCAGCHTFGSVDASGFAPDLNNKSDLIAAKLAAGHNGIALASTEVATLVEWVLANSVAVTEPPPEPTPAPLDGAVLYAAECAGCHGNLASTTKPGRTADQISAAIAGNLGNMGYIVLTTEEIQAIADVLPAGNAGPDYSDCTACHGQPPAGSAFPDGAGAHETHRALANVGSNCNVCHGGAAHNGWIDLGILPAYNAKSGTAGENPDGTATCVNVSCHGGKTTPDWSSGSISTNSACAACHALGTSQYNSYNSGQHSRGAHVRQACTACHNTSTLAANHFNRLDTPTMEGPAAATIGGGSTRISSYNASTRTCTNSCHGSENW